MEKLSEEQLKAVIGEWGSNRDNFIQRIEDLGLVKEEEKGFYKVGALLIYFNGTYSHEATYGFDSKGKWSEDMGFHRGNACFKATDEAVSEAFSDNVNEMLPVGTIVECMKTGKLRRMSKETMILFHDNKITTGNSIVLYEDGKWCRHYKQV